MNFKSARSAFQFVLSCLPHNYMFFSLNGGKHALLKSSVKSDPLYYCLFKKDFFHSFGEVFEGEKGAGESINLSSLEKAIKLGVDWLLFVYPDGKIYRVSPLQVKVYGEKYHTIRVQDVERYVRNKSPGWESVRELTVSFPLRLLEKWSGVVV